MVDFLSVTHDVAVRVRGDAQLPLTNKARDLSPRAPRTVRVSLSLDTTRLASVRYPRKRLILAWTWCLMTKVKECV